MFPKLNAPHIVMCFIYKGLLRALAAFSIGIFIYGVIERNLCIKYLYNKYIMLISGLIFFCYCIYNPFSFELDYLILFPLGLFIINLLNLSKEGNTLSNYLSKYSSYMYFSQSIVYSFKKYIFNINANSFIICIILLSMCLIISYLVMKIDEKIIKRL